MLVAPSLFLPKICSCTLWQCKGMMLLVKRGNPPSEPTLQLAAPPGSRQVQDADPARRGCSWKTARVCSALPWSVPGRAAGQVTLHQPSLSLPPPSQLFTELPVPL